ncbi:MAG: FdtA/QdtA family cupin domain-containing protein [Alphaproteobacteria bacterium]
MILRLPTIHDVRRIDVQFIADERGALTILDEAILPLEAIRRVFVVHGEDGVSRGDHAHIRCAQLLVCLTGRCTVEWTDGTDRASLTLDTPRQGLLIPAGIWSHQVYDRGATLMVLCDRSYEADDYIRDYDQFLAFRREMVPT